MIGSYRGSSGADVALKRVVEGMVMPGGIDVRLGWPVFSPGAKRGTLMSYQRRETEYLVGQQSTLLEIDGIMYDIFIWSENENHIQSIMDHLESGFNNFPLRDGFQSVSKYLRGFDQIGSVPSQATSIVSELDALLSTGSVSQQEENLSKVNQLLSDLTRVAVDAEWSTVLDRLGTIQSRMVSVPPYNFYVTGCRDLTPPEVYQLGLSGRVFTVVEEFTAAT